jgi:TonB family protein
MAHTILLVDYEPRTVTRVTEALAPLGCQILTAKDVDAAVGACARVEPRVVLITSVMPKVKVEDAITQVRARAGLRHTPFIVLMSGYSGDDPKGDASRLGAQDIVAKPFSGDDLLARVRAALQAPRGAAQPDSKADVLDALRRSAGLKPDKGTLTSEDLFGDLIGDADEDRPVAAETQRIAVTPTMKPAPPAEPEPKRATGETQRVPLDLVMQATMPAAAAPKTPKPAAKSAASEADKAVADSLSGMLDHPAKAGKVREDTGGASVDALLHQTLSGLEGGLPKRKAAPRPPDEPVAPAPAPTPQPAAPARPAAQPAAPAHEPAPASPSVGTLFGQYELMEVISTGGMAEVFKARMKGVEGFQKIVAIKRILPHLTENDEFVTMFIDEAKLAAQLQHPNIIHIYDLGKIERSYYIAMEYIDGKDLRSLLRLLEEKGQRLPLGLALYIASRLAAALDYAHRKRDFQGRAMALVHRDVSPQNVLISLDGDIKLCDFGIAKAASKASHTRAGALKGKLQYMSPEQAWGKDLDHRSDIFSLGVVMYEMVTGKKAFSGDSELSILEQVRSPKLQAPRQIDPSVPPEVERIILRAIESNRETRYQTAAELGSDLDAALRTVRPAPGSAELGAFLAHLIGRDRTGAMPAVAEPPTPKRGAARHEARPEPAPRKAEPPAVAPHAAEAAPQLEVAQPVLAKKPLPIGIIAAAAAVVLGVVIVYVVATRRAPATAPSGQVAATPAAETVEMARQIAQAEVQKREGEMRERLTRELLTATPVPRVGTTPAPAATRPAAAPAQPTQVPEAVPTEAPAAALPPPTQAPAVQVEPTPMPTAPPAPAPQRAPEVAAPAAVQRGDLVDMADTDVQAVDTPKPAYPPLAKQQRIGGVVILRALIDENGSVQDVQVLRGVKPDLGLDAAASGAVRRWRFRPATKGGVPVKLWKTITIPFQP